MHFIDCYVSVRKNDSVILFDTTMQDYEMIWRDYFDFGRDYGRIKAALLQTDDTLKEAVETMQGVHILQQEFFGNFNFLYYIAE